MDGAAPTRRWILAAGSVSLLVAIVLALADRPRLRSAEGVYVAGRVVTACATRQLAPFASGRDLSELPVALEEILTDARGRAAAVRERSGRLPRGVLPPTRAATVAVGEALDAQVALYEAMVNDPTGSQDELLALGSANARAESSLASARRWLVAGEGEGWDRRSRCPTSAGDQAPSASSSSSK